MFSKKKRLNNCVQRRSSLQVNLSFASDSDTSDTELNTINNKQEILDDNVKRLREAILNKTREIFDNQNDFCKKTATVLGSDQNDQNQSNSQEKKRLNPVLEESDSNDFTSKPSTSKKGKFEFSPIVSSSQPKNSIIFSPRRTRSSRASLLNNREEISLGNPIKCSTFTTNNSTVLEGPEARRTTNVQCDTPKSTKPVIRTVRSCYIPLDKIDGFERVNKSRNLREIPMELTPAVGNPILMAQSNRNQIDKSGEMDLEKNNESARTSLEVRTSVDGILSDSTSQLNIQKDNKSVLSERNSQGRRSLSLNRSNRSNRSTKFIHPALIESPHQSQKRRISDDKKRDRSSLDVNTSLGSQRRSTNASIVEGTPYPVSRSTLMRTQSRFTTVLEKKSEDSMEGRGNSCNPKSLNPLNLDPGPSTSFQKLEDTIVLDNSYSHKGAIIKDSDESDSDDQRPRESPLEDSSDDERSEPDDHHTSPAKKRPKKRKLFTQLNDSGPISLSPMMSPRPSPKPKTPVRPVKRRRKIHQILINKIPKKSTEIETQTQKKEVIKNKVKFVKKKEEKKTKKRKVLSKKIVIKKKINPDVLRLLEDPEEDNSEQGRDSLNDFTDNKRIVTKGRQTNKCIYIVTTGLCNGDKDLVKSAVKKIGGAKIESSVTRQTTHIITTGVRTINLLRGIIRGCWLVNLKWLKKSIEKRTWQDPENYEIDHFSKAVRDNRRDREIFGRSFVPELFATCGLIYVDGPTTPPADILKELIKTAGGRIIENPQKAKIVIGPKGLREVWILDSITTGELQPMDEYRR